MLEFLTQNQSHKVQRGYFINHHSLIVLNEEDRQKLITYFIAMQTPLKLDPEDRLRVQQLESGFNLYQNTFGLVAAVLAYRNAPSISTKYNPRITKNLVLRGLATLGAYWMTTSVCNMVAEPSYMIQSQVVSDLADKYKFTIYDFAQSKKESQVASLVNALVSESSGTLYS